MDDRAEKEKQEEKARDFLSRYRLYTLDEIAPAVGLSRSTLLRFIKKGQLNAVKIARAWRVSQSGLDAFFKSLTPDRAHPAGRKNSDETAEGVQLRIDSGENDRN